MWVYAMIKEINFPCLQCSHVDVCRYEKDMMVLDEQLRPMETDNPYANINITCDKFSSKDQILKRG